MSRSCRLVCPGWAHHVTHRGNRGNPVFLNDRQRLLYLRLMAKYCARYDVSICAYCLMDNHVHLIAIPRSSAALSRAIHDAHGAYAREFHTQADLVGHVWGNRFYSTPMDESHLWTAVRYVETNPVRAGMVDRAIDYPWSSARANAGLSVDPLLARVRPFPGAIEDWAAWLDAGIDRTQVERMRELTLSGHPACDDASLPALEVALGRPLKKRARKCA